MNQKAKKFLALVENKDDLAFKKFDKATNELKQQLKKEIKINTLEEVNAKIDAFRKNIDITPLKESVKEMRTTLDEYTEALIEELGDKLEEFEKLTESNKKDGDEKLGSLNKDITILKETLNKISEINNQSIDKLKGGLAEAIQNSEKLNSSTKNFSLESLNKLKSDLETARSQDLKQIQSSLNKLNLDIDLTKADILTRIANTGGGNANRNILIGSNPSVLSKYTDINLKAGSNVTITYQNNEALHTTDVTISATGGGSSVAGTVRSINTINTSQTGGSVAGTDYVYLCTAGVKFTLPNPANNTNLYTIKNISNSSVLVAGTIDDDANGIIMPVKYTSVDIISNNSDWNIT